MAGRTTISIAESAVLSALHLDADLPMTTVASLTNTREHSVRRILASLRERGLIHRVTLVNWFALGFIEHSIALSISAPTAKSRRHFVEQLLKNESVGWVREGGGACRYEFSIVSRSAEDMLAILESLLTAADVQMADRFVSQVLFWHVFKRKFLPKVIEPSRHLVFSPTGKKVEIDETDWSIIRALTSADLFTFRELGKTVGIPAATAEYRYKSLRKKGVITASLLELELQKLGIQHVRVYIRVGVPGATTAEQLFRFAKVNRSIIAIAVLFGAWDFGLRVEAFDAEEIGNVIDELAELLGNNLRDIQAVTVFGVRKFISSGRESRKGKDSKGELEVNLRKKSSPLR